MLLDLAIKIDMAISLAQPDCEQLGERRYQLPCARCGQQFQPCSFDHLASCARSFDFNFIWANFNFSIFAQRQNCGKQLKNDRPLFGHEFSERDAHLFRIAFFMNTSTVNFETCLHPPVQKIHHSPTQQPCVSA